MARHINRELHASYSSYIYITQRWNSGYMHIALLMLQYLAIVNKENTNDHTRKL